MSYHMYDVVINEELQRRVTSRERRFLICKTCFWCASLFNDTPRAIETCPSCMNSTLESMPISFDETYKLDYNPRRGITLEFNRIK